MDAWRALMNQQRDACRTAPTHPAHPQGRQLPKHRQQDLELLEAASVPQEEPSEPTAVCVHGHTSLVSEILSRGVIFEAVPCPACVQNGDLPPFCFNRKDCLLFFSEDALNTPRKGAMECRQCAAHARPSSIRILDIIVPEVFISYNWACSTNLRPSTALRPLSSPSVRASRIAPTLCVGLMWEEAWELDSRTSQRWRKECESALLW